MIDHVLTARNLITNLAILGDIDAPVVVQRGLFGDEFTYIRAIGQLGKPDLHIDFPRSLHRLVIADAHYDDPPNDTGWEARAHNLSVLMHQLGEGH